MSVRGEHADDLSQIGTEMLLDMQHIIMLEQEFVASLEMQRIVLLEEQEFNLYEFQKLRERINH